MAKHKWHTDWLGWFVMLALFAGLVSTAHSMADIGHPFGSYLTFYNPIAWRWNLDSVTPLWWSDPNTPHPQLSDRLVSLEGASYNDFAISEPALFAAAANQNQATVELVLNRNDEDVVLAVPLQPFSWVHFLDLRLPDLINGFGFWLLAWIVYRSSPEMAVNRVFTLTSGLVAANRWLSRPTLFWMDGSISRFFSLLDVCVLSFLGVAWSMLNPLGMMIVMAIVFSTIFGSEIEYRVFLLSGLLAWNFFAEASSLGIGSMVWGGDLMQQVFVPRSAFVVASVGTGVVNLMLAIVPLLGVMVWVGVPINWAVLFAPIPALLILLFTLGVSLILSVGAMYFADVNEMFKVVLRAWMYLTPIVYPESLLINNGYEWMLTYNPMYYLVRVFRVPFQLR